MVLLGQHDHLRIGGRNQRHGPRPDKSVHDGDGLLHRHAVNPHPEYAYELSCHNPNPDLQAIVGRLFGNRDIMGMALLQSGGSDPDKTRFVHQFIDVLYAAISHAGAQTA